MTDSKRSVGIHLSEDTIDHYDDLADRYDTNRATVMRALLEIGTQMAHHMEEKGDEDRLREFLDRNEAQTAPEMTEQGNHPRWDSP